jgi:hypothetical protein
LIDRRVLSPGLTCLALLVSACGGGALVLTHPPLVPPVFDDAIVGGHRIGPISLGMTQAELLQHLGPPSQTLTSTDFTAKLYRFDSVGLTARVVGGVVDHVRAHAARYTTSAGIHLGSPEADVARKQGVPAWRRAVGGDPADQLIDHCYADRTLITVGGPGGDPAHVGKVREIQLNGCAY